MIEYIRGKLAEKEIMHIAVEASGVGYAVNIPLSTYEKLPEPGKEVKVYIHYYVREDAVRLYGFSSETEREIFRHLISISKIGPKVALGILSGVSVDNLVSSINTADSSTLEKIPGVGAKTAQRLVIELKGKLAMTQSVSSPSVSLRVPSDIGASSEREEAFAAMIALGYNEKQVLKAVARVEQVIETGAPVEEWIRMALKVI
ncbi:MAG: Holliday junction branch migration protein RuvA [Chitinispirillaceae bacterium]